MRRIEMKTFNNLIGKRFGRLVVLERAENKNKHVYWLCQCDCGNKTIVRSQHLTDGKILSCGCYVNEKNTRHGKAGSRIYKIWHKMIRRCEKPTDHAKYYKDKGVKVCPEWHDFNTFYSWSMENGYNDALTIDRINGNGNYEPSNCRWVTQREQARNTSRNVKFNGVCQSEWAELLDVSETRLTTLRNKGYSLREALKIEYEIEKDKEIPNVLLNIDFSKLDEYQLEAAKTINPVLSEKELIINSCLGMAGETGEFIEHIKKWQGQGHSLDETHIVFELGDILFYISQACTAFGMSLGHVAKMNIRKLRKRYGETFESAKSINRTDDM